MPLLIIITCVGHAKTDSISSFYFDDVESLSEDFPAGIFKPFRLYLVYPTAIKPFPVFDTDVPDSHARHQWQKCDLHCFVLVLYVY